MNALILGGNSPRHKQWIRTVKNELRPYFNEIKTIDYAHWQTGEPLANIPHEIDAAKQAVTHWDDYIVIGKSIGTVIAAIGAAKGDLKAQQYFFFGIPFDGIAGRTAAFTAALKTLPAVTVVQNEHDPYGDALSAKRTLDALQLQQYTFVKIPDNNTHDYDVTPFFKSGSFQSHE